MTNEEKLIKRALTYLGQMTKSQCAADFRQGIIYGIFQAATELDMPLTRLREIDSASMNLWLGRDKLPRVH